MVFLNPARKQVGLNPLGTLKVCGPVCQTLRRQVNERTRRPPGAH